MEVSKTLFCSSKFPWAREKNFFEICVGFGHAPSKRLASPVLHSGLIRPADFVSEETKEDVGRFGKNQRLICFGLAKLKKKKYTYIGTKRLQRNSLTDSKVTQPKMS
jgi:hypothetical protein